MEDIKEKTADEILEKNIKRIKEIIKDLKEHIEFEDYDIETLHECSTTVVALENILMRYKQLEKENKELNAKLEEINKINFPIG